MTSAERTNGVTRRAFITVAAGVGAGLVLGVRFGVGETADWTPNAWLRVADDGTITILAAKAEMGQGVFTALPMIVAEELDADWERVRIEPAPARAPYDSNTGGSDSARSSFTPLRQAGAAARAMLIAAAAAEWQVPANECSTTAGTVVHAASGQRATYGQLAARAASMPAPDAATLRLKSPDEFRFIGKPIVRRDLAAKCDGSAVFGLDVRVPDMLVASVARCPVFDGRLAHVDDRRALAVHGVRKVIRLEAQRAFGLPARVAVVADTTWQALKSRRVLDVRWDAGTTTESSDRVLDAARAAMDAVGDPSFKIGDVDAARAAAAHVMGATYEVPFLAHATMEPMNCTAHVTESSAEIWVPSQFGDGMRAPVANFLNLPLDAVTVHVTFLGGGFGRRYYRDFVIDAVEIARAAGRPVKVVWSREEDVQHDMYRPLSVQRIRAALDARGRPTSWEHRVAGPAGEGYWRPTSAHPGTSEQPDAIAYDIPNRFGDVVYVDSTIPIGAWRAVRHTQNMFAIESFVDELAHAVGADPIAYRMDLLSNDARARHVLELVRDASDWSSQADKTRGRGVAFMNYAGTRVAHVAEVGVGRDGTVTLARMTTAFDCGQMINPDTVRAQIEGSIAWGMSAALWGEITVLNGRTVQSNFNDYRVARMRDMPVIDVRLVVNHEEPSGVGEPAVPGVAPAMANAIFAATGRRIRRLPIGHQVRL